MKTKFSLFIIRILIFPTFFSSISIFWQFWLFRFLFPVQIQTLYYLHPIEVTNTMILKKKMRFDETYLRRIGLSLWFFFDCVILGTLDWNCCWWRLEFDIVEWWNAKLNFWIEFCFWHRVLRGNGTEREKRNKVVGMLVIEEGSRGLKLRKYPSLLGLE